MLNIWLVYTTTNSERMSPKGFRLVTFQECKVFDQSKRRCRSGRTPPCTTLSVLKVRSGLATHGNVSVPTECTYPRSAPQLLRLD